jgi:hypothetical protein
MGDVRARNTPELNCLPVITARPEWAEHGTGNGWGGTEGIEVRGGGC